MAKTKGKTKGKSTKATKRAVARKPGPRSQALPGMESKIPLALRNICENIGEIREKKNQLAQDEREEIGRALKIMRESHREVVKWAGVEMVFVKGDDKLRVRLVSDGGDGEDAGADPTAGTTTEKDNEPFNGPATDRHADQVDHEAAEL